jgi:molecular chaperone IbpA
MRTYDFTPLWRSTVGFDRLFDQIHNTQQLLENQDGYPPYDIVRTGEESFRILVALAGFTPDDIAITAQQNLLTVAGRQAEKPEQDCAYKGISAGPFERRFSLADHVEVERAALEDGLLQIDLVRRVPEALKPRRIEIGGRQATSRDEKAQAFLRVA